MSAKNEFFLVICLNSLQCKAFWWYTFIHIYVHKYIYFMCMHTSMLIYELHAHDCAYRWCQRRNGVGICL